jgi:hypothetical protein
MNDNPTPDTDDAQFGTGRVSVDFARRMERDRNNSYDAIRKAVLAIDDIRWGNDGDCGAQFIIDTLSDILPENQ